jgi:hypothetical protein
MCNHERLLEYLYNELPDSDRHAFERHLDECGACRAELASLGGTRLALASWSPPEPELGFKVVRDVPPGPRRAWSAFTPAWGLAAAALLVLAVAAAVANVEVRYDASGLAVRTGWSPAPSASGQAVPAAAPAQPLAEELRVLRARLDQLEKGNRPVRAASLPGDAADGTPRMSDAELLRAVRKIIAESETRQQRELALRVTQVVRDFDATRAGDLARVEQGLRQIQGLTDAELVRHRDTLNHLLRVTQR